MGLHKLNKISKHYTSAMSDKGKLEPGSAHELEEMRKKLKKEDLSEDPESEELEEADRAKQKPKKA